MVYQTNAKHDKTECKYEEAPNVSLFSVCTKGKRYSHISKSELIDIVLSNIAHFPPETE